VQAIKRPALLEITGPLFMSYPAANNVQYRFSEEAGETIIRFCHAGFGLIPAVRKELNGGWNYIHEQARQRAEAARA
jgi:hypothetical protein